jgi:hypothetical protein
MHTCALRAGVNLNGGTSVFDSFFGQPDSIVGMQDECVPLSNWYSYVELRVNSRRSAYAVSSRVNAYLMARANDTCWYPCLAYMCMDWRSCQPMREATLYHLPSLSINPWGRLPYLITSLVYQHLELNSPYFELFKQALHSSILLLMIHNILWTSMAPYARWLPATWLYAIQFELASSKAYVLWCVCMSYILT